MGHKIKLCAQELYIGGLVGYRRNLEAIMSGRKPRFPEKYPGELFAYHIHAAMAELAVAKYLDMYWGFHVNKFDTEDVGSYEIRWSMRHDLKIRERDSGIVISVTGLPPEFEVVGWISGPEARDRFEASSPRSDGPPAYFIPHKNLYDPDLLLKK